jgi:hypothetical protein
MGDIKSSGKALGKFIPNPKLKLREQLAQVCRYRHLSHRTEKAYWSWIRDFLRFWRGRDGGDARPHPGPLPQGEGGGAGNAGPEAGAPGAGLTKANSTPLPQSLSPIAAEREGRCSAAAPIQRQE